MDLCEAIQKRHPISFYYKNKLPGKRTVYPYALVKTRSNRDALFGYLKKGVSYSNDVPPLRVYRLDRIKKLRIHKRTFRSRGEPLQPHNK
jgi:predicted DNA-binding transcriptional regulator YafY